MGVKKRILVVDDEWNMLNLLRIHLSKKYEVVQANDGYEALGYIARQNFDLVILDIMMPYLDGWELCKKIRGKYQMPILMLTARNEVKDRVQGLELGADDYLVKPFAFEELSARVCALLRRANINKGKDIEEEESISENGLTIVKESRKVTVNDQPVEFTPKEFELMWLIASQPQRVFTRELLLDNVWGIDDDRDVRTVDTHIKNIRIKLKEANCSFNPVKTVWGVGYTFQKADKS